MKMPSAGKVSACRGMFSFDTYEMGSADLKPSQALPRQLPRRGSFLHLPVTTNKAPPERTDFPRPGENVTAGDKRGELASRSDD